MADQFNSGIPSLGNQLAEDVPDIKENLEFLKDVFENFVNEWSNTVATGIYPAKFGLTSVSSDTTLAASDGPYVEIDCSGGAVTVTLPSAAATGIPKRIYILKLVDSTNAATLDPDGAETIDGDSSFVLSASNEAVAIVSDGANWKILFSTNSKTTVADTISEYTSGNGVTIDSLNIKDAKLNTNDSVITANLTDACVTTAKIADASVTTAKIGNLEVTEEKLASGSVAQAKLKTSSGSVSVYGTSGNLTLPGGEYGFYPQVKVSGGTGTAYTGVNFTNTSYVTNIYLEAAAGEYTYAQQRYVTSSGEVFWVFLMREKTTKQLVSAYQAPDHPCFGNGGDPLLVQHPFPEYDSARHEIIVVNPARDLVREIHEKARVLFKDFMEILMADYELDEQEPAEWPEIPVTVDLIRDPFGEFDAEIVKKPIPKPGFVKAVKIRQKGVAHV